MESYVKQLKTMPKENAKEVLIAIEESDEKLFGKIVDVLKDEKLGVTPHEKDLRAKGVTSGDRARAIFKDLEKIESKEEKRALLQNYLDKRILNDDVAEQLKILIDQKAGG